MNKDKFTITINGITTIHPESERNYHKVLYLEGMRCCEGSEAERYKNLYVQLLRGEKNCTDEDPSISYVYEHCPECECDVKLLAISAIQVCPNCSSLIKPCALCDMVRVNCSKCYFDK